LLALSVQAQDSANLRAEGRTNEAQRSKRSETLVGEAQSVEAQSVEAHSVEARLLGQADESQALDALQLFRRQFHASGIVTGSLAASTSFAGVPMSAMLDPLRALQSALDLERDLKSGDRFTVCWEQEFTINGDPVGVARVLSVELGTHARGPLRISRFRPLKGEERFYLADGTMAGPPPVRLPLDHIQITSGFGLRRDPLDQPQRVPPVAATPETEAGPPTAPAQEHSVADRKEIAKAYAGFLGSNGLSKATDGRNADVDRIMAERRVRAREEAARKQAEKEAAEREGERQASPPAPPPAPPKPVMLFMHEGLDLFADVGVPIHAAANGVVTLARPDRGYGNAIHIDHGDGLDTIYGHLSGFASGLQPGSLVSRGDVIGFVGSTGRSTGAHLHFEVLVGGHPVDPSTMTKAPRLAGLELARFRKKLQFEERMSTQDFLPAEARAAASPVGATLSAVAN
jgi:murein DD-endopeptidase MepM/ murein hydrolase activator NlpD